MGGSLESPVVILSANLGPETSHLLKHLSTTVSTNLVLVVNSNWAVVGEVLKVGLEPGGETGG